MNGQFIRQTSELSNNDSWQWLQNERNINDGSKSGLKNKIYTKPN